MEREGEMEGREWGVVVGGGWVGWGGGGGEGHFVLA